MPWRPLPQIAFAVAVYPFEPSLPDDLPLELGDELYIIEQDGVEGAWYRGYLVAPPSLLAGLTSIKGQTLEARVFSGVFPRSCVEVREFLGESNQQNGAYNNEDGETEWMEEDENEVNPAADAEIQPGSLANGHGKSNDSGRTSLVDGEKDRSNLTNGTHSGVATKSKSASTTISTMPEIPLTRSLSRRTSSLQKEKGLGRGLSFRSVKSQKSQRSQRSTLPKSPVPVASSRDPDTPKPQAPVPMLKVGDETPTSAQEPLVDEIASSLREWHSTNLHELLLARRYEPLEELSSLVKKLDFARRQLLHTVLTDFETGKLREQVVWDLVQGNKLIGAEVIVRDPARGGRILVGSDSAVDVAQLQATMSLLEEAPFQHQEPAELHHLLVQINSFTGPPSESPTFVFYLCSKVPGNPPVQISETFAEEIPSLDSATHGHLGKLRTLFVDLTVKDLSEGASGETEVYLVVKVQSEKLISCRPPASAGEEAATRDGSNNTTFGATQKTPSSRPIGNSKAGRRSLMWGAKASGGSYFSRSSPSNAPPRSAHDEKPPSSSPSSGAIFSERSPGAPTSDRDNIPKASKALVKRTKGVGIIRVGHLLKSGKESEQAIQIWAPSTTSNTNNQVHGWEDIIAELIESQNQTEQFTNFGKLEKLHVRLNSFAGNDADSLIRKTPTLLQHVDQTPKIGFAGAPTRARSDIYITLSEVYIPRHAILSHPQSGTAPLISDLNFSNLQISLEVRRPSGESIPNCIFPSSNSNGVTSWHTTAAEKGESWNQVIKLVVPPEMVQTSHIMMTLVDSPGPPLALAWMPLWDQQAFVKDGHHSLLMHKYDDTTSIAASSMATDRGGYLSFPWNTRSKDGALKDEALTGPLATLRIHSYLCSTMFSQEKVLLGVLKWREQPHEELIGLLKQLVFVPEIEIVKLLSEVFDALFGILVEQAGSDEHEDLVFSALITVLSIVHDRRFNLGPLVDHYAESRFNYPFASSCLIRSFTRLLSNSTDPETARKLRATFKVGRQVFKFIINAREQQKAKEAGIGITSSRPNFTRDLQNIFRALEALMRNSTSTLVGTQTLAVQYIHTWLPELAGYLTTEDILHIAIDFLDSCAAVKGKLILYKLILIDNFSRLDLFSEKETRRTLVINTVRWLAPHWGRSLVVTDQYRDQVRLCCSVLSTQINHLERQVSEYLPKIVESYKMIHAIGQHEKDTFSLLFPRTYPFPTKPIKGKQVFDEALVELSTILAAIWNLPTRIRLEYRPDALSELLSNVLDILASILSGQAFPRSWLSMHIYQHLSALKTLEYVASVLIDSFLPQPDDAESFNTELWRAYLSTLLKLVGSNALSLETFPEQKRRAVWKIAGDVREQGAELLRKSWDAIGWESSSEDRRRFGLEKMGGYQVQYVPGLVGPVVALCMSVHEGLRSVAVRTLQTMIVSEWTLSQDLSVVQVEMIECLDKFFKEANISESVLQKLFIGELMDLFEPLASLPEEPLNLALKDLISSVDEYLDLLVAVHTTSMPGEASHIMATLRLMDFLRGVQKDDIFIRYVHQLADVQLRSRSPAEAGLAIRLHADLYDWDTSKRVPALQDPEMPTQTAFERKESLYFSMINNYEEGKSWEIALVAYKELAQQYESNVYDFSKLARTQRAMAKVLDAISRGERQQPRYFRVIFKGLGFPISLRDKQFIFEGGPHEKLAAFTDRMQQQHPSAQLLPSNEMEDLEGQFLQISAVSPYRDLYNAVHQRAKVAQSIREHVLFARPSHFSTTTRRSPGNRPVAEQWIEKTLYSTAEQFPTILKRSEIVNTEEIRLSAIQSAIERTMRKTQELTTLEQRLQEGNQSSFPPFAEAITTSIEMSTEGSVAQYHELLSKGDETLTEAEEAPANAEQDPFQQALSIALIDHAMVIKRCLALYPEFGGSEVAIHLTRQFEMVYEREVAALSANISQPSRPPSPPQLPLSPKESVPQSNKSMLQGVLDNVEKTKASQESGTRSAQPEKNRISLNFLKRSAGEDESKVKVNGYPAAIPEEEPNVQERSRSRSRSKSINRRSFLGGFDMDKSKAKPRTGGSPPRRRSGSSHRPDTSNSNIDTLNSSKGSVKKRFSMLRLGKKNSKVRVNVDSVKEE
ncbi:MAG: hypothetical protein M1833_006769 [Piccolia ochrophora]|nr:MAG: hypothetical protein M1833_006769 [Piccolia ochrophora]